jgi:hypothetical protein
VLLRNPNCIEDIMLDKIGMRRMAIILAIILYKQLQRALGRKSSNVEGQSVFGMTTIKVELYSPTSY